MVVLVSVFIVISQSDEERGKYSDHIQDNLKIAQPLSQEDVAESHGEYWGQLLDDTYHADAEEVH